MIQICEKSSAIHCRPWLLLGRCTQVTNILCGKVQICRTYFVGKGGGLHGGLYCLWKAIQIE